MSVLIWIALCMLCAIGGFFICAILSVAKRDDLCRDCEYNKKRGK